MAQTVSTWQIRATQLARTRNVLFYEAAGLGNVPDRSLFIMSRWKRSRIDKAFPSSAVDVAGFSLGGRIAMAAATQETDRFRKLPLTGVALRRSDYGYLQLLKWKDHLQHGNVHACSWLSWTRLQK